MLGHTRRPTRRTASEGERALTLGLALSLLFAVVSGLSACGAPAPDVVPIEVRIGSEDPRCAPGRVRAVRLSMEGDFSPGPTDTIELLSGGGVRDLLAREPAPRALLAELDGERGYRAIGWSDLDGLRRTGALAVLPPLAACAVIDPDVFAPEGAVVLAHPDGSAWVVGGRDAARRVLRIDPRTAFAEVSPSALFNRRLGASASVLGEEVLVAGGASDDLDGAHDSFERLDRDGRRVEGGGQLLLARRDHGALVSQGRVVLVGGRTGGARDALVAPIEVIEPGRGAEEGSSRLGPPLLEPRLGPTLLERSDHSIVVAGGLDAAGRAVSSIEVIDAALERTSRVELALPPADAWFALPLDRLLHVAGGELRIVDVRADPPRIERLARRSAIASPRGVVTGSGRVLLSGPSASGRVVTELWVPHLGVMSSLDALRAPSASVWLGVGVALELDSGGGWLRALDEPSAWASLPNDRHYFATEWSSRFLVAASPSDFDAGRATRDGARVALAGLSLLTFSVHVEARGALVLRVRGPTLDAPVELHLDASGAVRGPGCELSAERAAEHAPIALQRVQERLSLVGSGGARVRCDDVPPDALVSIELEAAEGTELRSIELSRGVR